MGKGAARMDGHEDMRCGYYVKRTVRAGRTVEVTRYYSRRLGATGNGRERIAKGMSREAEESKWKRAEDRVRWLLNENFRPGDLWMRMSLPGGQRLEREEAVAVVRDFLRRLKREYGKRGCELRYVYTAGLGRRGGLHFHIVLPGCVDSAVVERCWHSAAGTAECPYPSTNTRHLYEECSYGKLAAYLIKNSRETWEGRLFGKRYCRSRSLREPEVERRIVRARRWHREPRIPAGWRLISEVSAGLSEGGYPYQWYAMAMVTVQPPQRGRPRKGRQRDEQGDGSG